MTTQTMLPLRHDTILGVCEAIGQDFGFNPTWLRLAFIAPIFFAPVWTVAAYLVLGVLVVIVIGDRHGDGPAAAAGPHAHRPRRGGRRR